MRVLREHTQPKWFDLERSSYIGQINQAQNANLKVAIINGGLLLSFGADSTANSNALTKAPLLPSNECPSMEVS